MQLGCKHKDRLENKEIFASPWEQMSEAERKRAKPAPWMFRHKVVLTFICSECGRMKTQTEKSDTELV